MVVSYRSFVSSLSRVLNLHLSRSDLQASLSALSHGITYEHTASCFPNLGFIQA